MMGMAKKMNNVLRLWPFLFCLMACSGTQEGTQPGECRDRADNDANGLFDCDDPGCFLSPDCNESDADTDTDTDADSEFPDDWSDPERPDEFEMQAGGCSCSATTPITMSPLLFGSFLPWIVAPRRN